MQQCRRSTPVLGSARSAERAEAEVTATAPVARDRAKCRKALLPTVRRNTPRVDARTTDDGDSPAPLASRTEYGDRVVADTAGLRPLTRGERVLERHLLLGQVG